MANVYAVKTGNWSDITLWNTGALPTSADDVFSNTYTVTIDQDVTVLSIRNTAASPIVAGGGFILNGGLTINCTGIGLTNGNTTCLTYSSTGVSYINSNITNNGSAHCLLINSTGTLYIVGTISTNLGKYFGAIYASAACRIYITGLIRGAGSTEGRCIIVTNQATVYITGNVAILPSSNGAAITIDPSSAVYITGNVFYESFANSTTFGISSSGYLNIVGSLNAQTTNGGKNVVLSTSSSAVNLFSGPFICSEYGFMPYQVVRMHLIPTTSSYFEFRDETTNGALAPSAIAPATRMISPASASDAPIASNVRFGTNYALGSQIGTVRIPHPNNVSFGVPVDNTFGTAVLTPSDVWNAQTSTMNTDGSIGKRIKNAATVQSTGDQLSASL